LAIYVSDSTRRARVLGLAAACLVVGLVAGLVLGRATADGVDDAVASVREHAQDAVTALQRLPIEYEQALAGEGGEDADTITGALDRARADLDRAYTVTDELVPQAHEEIDLWFDTLAENVRNEVSQQEFELAISAAIARIQATFGLPSDLPLD
jgi:hypothetical protein